MNLVTDRARNLRRQARAMLKLRPPQEVLPASVEALALAEALRTLPVRQRQMPVPAVDRVLAFDQAGNQIAACRMRLGPGNSC